MKDTNIKLVNVSMRLSGETKEYFEELFQESGSSSKGEFIKTLLDEYTRAEAEPTIIKSEPEIIEKIVEVEKVLQENEIVINLNKLQFAIIEYLATKSQCRKVENGLIENINNGIDKTFWGNNIFSGDYNGLFTNYTCEDSPEKIKEDMGSHLINSLMALIAKGYYENIGINAKYIKKIKRILESEEQEDQELTPTTL